MTNFHLLTAVTRPENLPKIAKSIATASDFKEIGEVCWHLLFDPDHEHVAGQELKNFMLDGINNMDEWVMILDDDTILDSQVLNVAGALINTHRDLKAIVVSQARPGGMILFAGRDNLFVGGIDAGQAILRRDVIGDKRIPLHYCGDGEFLVDILSEQENVMFLSTILSYHNYLRPEG